MNYINNLLKSLESTYRKNMNKMAENNFFGEREKSSNYRFMKNTNVSNIFQN